MRPLQHVCYGSLRRVQRAIFWPSEDELTFCNASDESMLLGSRSAHTSSVIEVRKVDAEFFERTKPWDPRAYTWLRQPRRKFIDISKKKSGHRADILAYALTAISSTVTSAVDLLDETGDNISRVSRWHPIMNTIALEGEHYSHEEEVKQAKKLALIPSNTNLRLFYANLMCFVASFVTVNYLHYPQLSRPAPHFEQSG